jgi:hypothetical protein
MEIFIYYILLYSSNLIGGFIMTQNQALEMHEREMENGRNAYREISSNRPGTFEHEQAVNMFAYDRSMRLSHNYPNGQQKPSGVYQLLGFAEEALEQGDVYSAGWALVCTRRSRTGPPELDEHFRRLLGEYGKLDFHHADEIEYALRQTAESRFHKIKKLREQQEV